MVAEPRPKRARPLWREPLLIPAVAILLVAAAAMAVVAYDSLWAPVLQAPADGGGVPTRMPHGAELPPVPGPVADALDRPVVVVGSMEEPLGELPRCSDQAEWEFPPTLRAAVITPEGLTVSIRGEERGTGAMVHLTCFALWDGRGWDTWASWAGDALDGSAPAGPPQPVCCRDDGLALAGAEVQAPQGARWLVQDRGPYWLAYPVDDSGLVHPVWPAGDGDENEPPPTVYLDQGGQRLTDEPAEAEPPAEGE